MSNPMNSSEVESDPENNYDIIDRTGYDEKKEQPSFMDIEYMMAEMNLSDSSSDSNSDEENQSELENEYNSDFDAEQEDDYDSYSDDDSSSNADDRMDGKEKRKQHEIQLSEEDKEIAKSMNLSLAADELCDDDQDDKDTKWIYDHYIMSKKNYQSDGVLSCPCCFQTLCYECQQHELFENQYRAVQVYNCKVDPYQSLLFVNNKYKKIHKETQQNDDSLNSYFHPVYCEECETEVGVQDPNGLYIFYNVICEDPYMF